MFTILCMYSIICRHLETLLEVALCLAHLKGHILEQLMGWALVLICLYLKTPLPVSVSELDYL